MERLILDSSAMLHILQGTGKGQKIAAVIAKQEWLTSIICYCEVLNNVNLDKQAKAEAFLSKILIFPLTLAEGRLAKQFQDECRKTGRQVPTLDCLIAATAANNNATVITTDADFLRIDGIKKQVF